MRLSDQAASFLQLETATTPMHAAALSVIDGRLTLKSIATQVSRYLHLLPKYRQRLAFVPFNLAQPSWVDHDAFDLSEHIALDKLPTGTSLEEAIEHAVRVSQTLLPRDRPLWRIVLITGPRGQSLLLHIVHHAMLEGVGVADDAHNIFDLHAQPRAGTQTPAWEPTPVADSMTLIAQAVRDNTRTFSARTERLRNFPADNSEMIRRATESLTRFITEPVHIAPWNRGFVGPGRKFHRVQLPYSELRGLRRVLGGNDNDIVLTLLVEAAARYIGEHEQVGNNRHLRLMIPTRVRREDTAGVQSARVSGTFPVYDAERMPATERHQQVRWEAESIKQNREAQALQLLTELAPPLPAVPTAQTFAQSPIFNTFGLNYLTFNPSGFLRQLAPSMSSELPLFNPTFNSSMAGFNFSVTMLPGTQVTQYIGGQPVAEQLALPVLAGNLGYAVAVTTYAQSICFNLYCDPALLTDLPRMGELIEEVRAELAEAASEQAA